MFEQYNSDVLYVCYRSFTTFSASSELPCDTEATVVLWINKACAVMRARLEQQNATRVRDLTLSLSYHAFRDPSTKTILSNFAIRGDDGSKHIFYY